MSGAAVAAPYRGLGAYSEADAPFFFGRETLYEVFSDQLVSPLGEWRTRMLGERQVRGYSEEVERERSEEVERERSEEVERERRRVRSLLLTVAFLTALVVLLALLLVRGN